MSRVAANLRIEGRVQGVGYRWWAIGEARRLGLDGWARNRSDGSVEILAIGQAEAVDALAAACAIGPAEAQVKNVRRAAASDDGSRGFRQRESI